MLFGISPGSAVEILAARSDGSDVELASHRQPILGVDVPNFDLDELRRDLLDLKSEFPSELSAKTSAGSRFDRMAAELVHRNLEIPPAVSGRKDFWIWMSLELSRDIVDWRHGSDGQPAHPNNYSINNKHDGLLARLWFRAELSRTDGLDPYGLTRRGQERDFWDSGIIRSRYSSCRPLTRALVRAQYPAEDAGPVFHSTHELGIRMLYKRLKRIHATVALEVLDETGADALLGSLCHDLVRTGA